MAAIQFKPVGDPVETGRPTRQDYSKDETFAAPVSGGQLVRVVSTRKFPDGTYGQSSDMAFIPQKL